MPTNTFFALSAAKQRRLMDACWAEFACHAYENVSINRIVQKARIPRGSFYQYFEDKADLFCYLLSQIPHEITCLFFQEMRTTSNGTAQVLARVFDRLSHTAAAPTISLCRYLQVLRANPYLDWLEIFPKHFPQKSVHTPEERVALGIFLVACKQFLLHSETVFPCLAEINRDSQGAQ